MFDAARLDDLDALERASGAATLRTLAEAGAQVRRAIRATAEAPLDRVAADRPRGIVVAGAGGSAVVADLVAALTRSGPLPVFPCTDAVLPGWVGTLDLVVVVSLSGAAERPVAVAAEALRRGAAVLTVGAPDSALADVAARARGVHVPVVVPGASARTALWALATPVLLTVADLGLADSGPTTMAALADVLDRRARESRPGAESWENPAKLLAADVVESRTVLASAGVLAPVAVRRAATMFARTGRVPVTPFVLPDAASALAACFDGATVPGADGSGADLFADPFLDGPTAPPLRLVVLKDGSGTSEPDADLEQQVADVAQDAGVRVSTVEATEPGPVLRLASHIAATDFAAVYAALGQGVDPISSRHVEQVRSHR